MHTSRPFRFVPRSALLLSAAAVTFAALTGCGAGPLDTSSSGDLQISGSIYGGQQPVAQATVQLYAAGTTGNGSAARSELQGPVTSDANGNFTLTGHYTCASVEDQVYLAATGGNPGLAAGTNNPALVMVSLLGRCGDLMTTPFVSINELTTVAAAWAAAPFMKSATLVGATSTNSAGLKNAFLNAHLLVDPFKGLPAALPSNLAVEAGKLNSLANALASCVNTNGSTGTGTNCAALFSAATPSGGSAPADTLAAALNIVRNPGNNVRAVFNTASAIPPFANALSSAPNDWTMSLTVTGAGLSQPTAVSVDSTGNVWVADYPGLVSAFTPQGTPFNSTGYGIGSLSETYGLIVDANDNIWATILEQPRHSPTFGSVAKFSGYTSGNPGVLAGVYTDASVDYPFALSADTNGNVMVANYGNSSATIFTSSGGVVAGALGSGAAAVPSAIAADQAHGLWLANSGDSTVTHVAANGTVLARPTTGSAPNGVAVDALGNAWVANYFGSSVSEVSPAGAVTLTTASGAGGVSYPATVVIDGAQDVWVVNYRGTSFSHIAGNGGTVAAGTALSPASGLGQDASLVLPFGIAVDGTGNVWVSNNSNGNLVMFFGLATPVKTPVSPVPALP